MESASAELIVTARFDKLEKAIRAHPKAIMGRCASAEMIKEAQQTLGVTFTGALIEYLRRFGWLTLGNSELFGLGPDLRFDLVKDTLLERESGCALPRTLIPIYNDGGGSLYCVVVEGPRIGTIVFWDHDLSVGQVPDEMSPSLEDWLTDQLVPEPTELEIAERRALVADVLTRLADTDDLASYVGRNFSTETRQVVASHLLEFVSKHETDATLEHALRKDVGFTLNPRANGQTLREWLTRVALALLG